MMARLNTVRGAIDAAQLGVTLMHEHVFVLSTEVMQNYPGPWGDEERRVADAIKRLNELKAGGVDSIVDLTVIGLGRYIPRIKRIAAETDLNIIVATGVYTYNDVPFYFHYQVLGIVLGGLLIVAALGLAAVIAFGRPTRLSKGGTSSNGLRGGQYGPTRRVR